MTNLNKMGGMNAWDALRFHNLEERALQFFPDGTLLVSHDTLHHKPPKFEAPAETMFTMSRMWRAVKEFFVPPATEADAIPLQKEVLREIRETKDPRFLDLLIGITSHDVRLGRRLVYDGEVLSLADDAIVAIIPNLDGQALTVLESHTRQRLQDVEAFWTTKNREWNDALGGRDMDRIRALLEKVRVEIALRAREPGPLTVETHYISTHYNGMTVALLDTPVRILAGGMNMVERSNPMNLLPRALVGTITFVWDGITGIPGELAGLTTAGAYGYYGSELGQKIGDTAIVVTPLARKSRKVADFAKRSVKAVSGKIKVLPLRLEVQNAIQAYRKMKEHGGESWKIESAAHRIIYSYQKVYEIAVGAGLYSDAARIALEKGRFRRVETRESSAWEDFENAVTCAGRAGNMRLQAEAAFALGQEMERSAGYSSAWSSLQRTEATLRGALAQYDEAIRLYEAVHDLEGVEMVRRGREFLSRKLASPRR